MYEIFEHTADFGIRACGKDLDEVFSEAARGLSSILMANPDVVVNVQSIPIQVEAEDLETLFHHWLDELLYMFTARRLALGKFQPHITKDSQGNFRLSGTADGEPIDLKRHVIDTEVKAITWHALKIEQNADGWLAEVIVDV